MRPSNPHNQKLPRDPYAPWQGPQPPLKLSRGLYAPVPGKDLNPSQKLLRGLYAPVHGKDLNPPGNCQEIRTHPYLEDLPRHLARPPGQPRERNGPPWHLGRVRLSTSPGKTAR